MENESSNNPDALLSRYGKCFDGIDRASAPVLTTEHSYRLLHGFPEVYITCLYRWYQWPIAEFISKRAVELGRRLGKNILVIPYPGSEEDFWRDAFELIESITRRTYEVINLDDQRVYLIVSSVNVEKLPKENLPFLMFDISELSVPEFIGFYSKLLDLFDVSRAATNDVSSIGKYILTASDSDKRRNDEVTKAIALLAEAKFVLRKLCIRFCGFHWEIQQLFDKMLNDISNDIVISERLNNLWSNIQKLARQGDLEYKPQGIVTYDNNAENGTKTGYDLFLSYASEDKDFVRQLYQKLTENGIKVWFDEIALELGDSLLAKIDDGLVRCQYGVVVLSHQFFRKQWPRKELDGLVAIETAKGEKAILPVWHNIGRAGVLAYSPTLADRLAAQSSEGVDCVVEKIARVLRKQLL